MREPSGAFMVGFACNIGTASIIATQLLGVLNGLLLAWDKGFPRVRVEIDSHCVVSPIGSNLLDSHSEAPLLARINEVLRKDWHVQFCHISRENNRVVDALAHMGHDMGLGISFFDEPPLC